MTESAYSLNPNQIVRFLGKAPADITRADITGFIEHHGIKMLNFRYAAGDGRLKTLNFIISGKAHLDRLLSCGERVDGSSLFSFIDPAASDLYVIPRYSSAFVNPFSKIPSIDILCSFYTKDGTRLASAHEQIVRAAQQSLKEHTGLTMEAMGELEYYVFFEPDSLYPGTVRKGYHESSPFSKGEELRLRAMQAIAEAGGTIKYGHSEVGNIFGKNTIMEQHEIEFLPVPIEEAADQIILAKWMLRMCANQLGHTISFAPKISFGHAGSGLHVHTRLVKDGKSVLVENGRLSSTAKRVIAGYLTMASSLTAFGNTVPVSYLRLVPHQEAPTNVCWGERNRSTLVRVPLGWLNVGDMVKDANPQEKDRYESDYQSQTVEYRGGDGSADIYLLLAGLTVAARHGLTMEGSLELADSLYVDVNIFEAKNACVQEKLPGLPRSCIESAECLERDRAIYEKDNVIPAPLIDDTAKRLKFFNDRGLSEELYGKEEEIRKLVDKFIHCS